MFYLDDRFKNCLANTEKKNNGARNFYPFALENSSGYAFDLDLEYNLDLWSSNTHVAGKNKPITAQINFFQHTGTQGYSNISFMQGPRHFFKGITLNGIPLKETSTLTLVVSDAYKALKKQLGKVHEEFCKNNDHEPNYFVNINLAEYEDEWILHFQIAVHGDLQIGGRYSKLLTSFIDELVPNQGLWRHPNLPEFFDTEGLDKVTDYPTHWCAGAYKVF